MYDCIIIGAGVTGVSVARELSKYDLKIAVLEKEHDLCCGTTKANSAILHCGYDPKPGTLMAKLNKEGSDEIKRLSKILDFKCINNGALIVCTDEDNLYKLNELYDRGVKNKVEGLEIIGRKKLRELEPNISKEAIGALWAKNSCIVDPFNLNVALGENAYENGAEFFFNEEVVDIIEKDGTFEIITKNTTYLTKSVINCAGVYGDEIHNKICKDKVKITPRRGDYFLCDKNVGSYVHRTIFALPGKMGKGVLVTPTVHGNLLIGPNAIDVEDKEDTKTTATELNEVLEKSSLTVENPPFSETITTFSGLRATMEKEDFYIKESKNNFFDVIGICSPGLSSSVAIGKMVSDMVCKKLEPKKKPYFKEEREKINRIFEMPVDEANRLIQSNPMYGNIICRCEKITEGEIVNAIKRPLGATTVEGIKKRLGVTMGRCGGGFCTPKIIEILSRELGVDYMDVTKSGKGTNYLYFNNKKGAK